MTFPRTLLVSLLCIILVIPVSISAIEINITQYDVEHENIFNLFTPPIEPIRNIAEFEPMEGVLIRYPFGISYQIIAEMSEDVMVMTIVASSSQQTTVQNAYLSNGVNIANCEFLITSSDSYWTRDYGPWFVFTGDDELSVIDFNYNRPRPNDNAIPTVYAVSQGFSSYYLPLDHAGGNYMTDSQGISISTDLVWSENTGYSHAQIDQLVEDYLGITTYHVVPDVNGEYIKHIDCWGKYLAPDKILIREVPSAHSQYDEIEAAVSFFSSQTSCYGTPYEIYRVYTPTNQPYTNSLILNDKVLVPITGSSWDDDAIDSYETAMPGYEVLGFTGSWVSSDALHCRAKGIPDRGMLYVDHTPLYGTINGDNGIDIETTIIPYSGYDLMTNACVIYWKENNGSWQSTQLIYQGNDLYQATIYPQEDDATISYYIYAEDQSGRTASHPFIGEADSYSFTVDITVTNSPPEQPTRPIGRLQGSAGSSYEYTSVTTDINQDGIYYRWDWDDGTFSDWLGPYTSKTNCSETHSWIEQGTYSVRVKAKDTDNAESNWSELLSVKMPHIMIKQQSPLLRFLPRISSVVHKVIQNLMG